MVILEPGAFLFAPMIHMNNGIEAFSGHRRFRKLRGMLYSRQPGRFTSLEYKAMTKTTKQIRQGQMN